MSSLKGKFITSTWFTFWALAFGLFFVAMSREGLNFSSGTLMFCGLLVLTTTVPCILFGHQILNATIVRNQWQAVLKGMGVSVVSFFLFGIGFPLLIALFGPERKQGLRAFAYVPYVWFYGAIGMGWAIVLIGAIAGVSLFLVRGFVTGNLTNQ